MGGRLPRRRILLAGGQFGGNPDDDDMSSDDAVRRLANWRRMLRMLSIKAKKGGGDDGEESFDNDDEDDVDANGGMERNERVVVECRMPRSISRSSSRTMGGRLLATAWDRRTRRKRTRRRGASEYAGDAPS